MALRLPSSPTVGQIITFNNKSYIWSGKSWNIYTSAAANANIVAISTEATEKANLALEQSNTVAEVAVSAFEQANTVGEVAVSAFVAANAAFDVANVALSTANNATDTWVRDAANSAALLAQAAFEQANTGGGGGGGGGTPTIATITPTAYDGRSGYTFTLAGTNYDLGTVVDFITANGTTHRASSTSVIDQANLSAVTPIPFYANNSPLSIKVTTSGGSSYTSNNVIQTGGVPIWNTSSGVLYTNAYDEDIQLGDNSYRLGMPVNEDVDAYDPDGQVITYNVVSGSLPPNTALNQVTGTITGTLPESLAADTTYSFQLGAYDQTGNMSIPRLFDIVVKNLPTTIDWTNYTVDHVLTAPVGNDGDRASDSFGNYGTTASGIYGAAGTNTTNGNSAVHIFNLVTGQRIATIDNPESVASYFGENIEMKGNYLVIGAKYYNDGNTNSGTVYIYRTETGDWSDVYLWKQILNPNAAKTAASDQFGFSVSIDPDGGAYGGWLVVGAPYEELGTTYTSAGYVYVYRLNGGTDPNNVILHRSETTYANSAFSGIGLAVTGNTVIYSRSVYTGITYGSLRMFDLVTLSGETIANTDPGNDTNKDYAQNMVVGVHDGKGYLMISVDTSSNNNLSFDGSVDVYESSDPDHWVGNTSLKFTAWPPANDGTSGAWYGHRMGFDAESGYLALGWYRSNMASGTSSGAVDIWDVKTATRVTTIYNPNIFGTTDNDYFGGNASQNKLIKIGITNRRMLVPASCEDELDLSGPGVCYVIKAGF